MPCAHRTCDEKYASGRQSSGVTAAAVTQRPRRVGSGAALQLAALANRQASSSGQRRAGEIVITAPDARPKVGRSK